MVFFAVFGFVSVVFVFVSAMCRAAALGDQVFESLDRQSGGKL